VEKTLQLFAVSNRQNRKLIRCSSLCPIGPLICVVGPCDLLLEAEGVFAGVFPEFSTPRRVGEGPNASHPQPPFSRVVNLLTTFRTQEKDSSCLPSQIFEKHEIERLQTAVLC